MGDFDEPPDEPPDDSAPDSDDLFDEYLDRWIEGEPPDLEELERRAGAEAAELRERAELLRQLGELADILQDGPAGPAEDPERIDHYQILQRLGEGGLARVYLAQDTQLEKHVALKVVDLRALDSERLRRVVLEEARALARVEHECVVRVLSVGEKADPPYVVMECVRGPSLRAVLGELSLARQSASKPARSPAAVELSSLAARARLVARLARALEACHANGVIHRDVKPANVLIDPRGVPKLIDFGLARRGGADLEAQRHQERYATLPYLAPELLARENREADAASDQYALGLVLYELLTLEHPLAREDREATRRAVAQPEIRSPRALRRDIPADLARVCMHALERDPKERYASLGEMAADLEAFLEFRAISLEEPGPVRRAWLVVRRRPVHAALAALVVVLIASLVGYVGFERMDRGRLISRTRVSLTQAANSPEPSVAMLQFYANLISAWSIATDYDDDALAGIVYDSVGRQLEELRVEGDVFLHQQLRDAYQQASDPRKPSGWNSESFQSVSVDWGIVMGLAELASPTGSCPCDYHRLGAALLSSGEKLERYSPNVAPNAPLLEPCEPGTRLDNALFRWSGHGPDGPWEVDVFGCPWAPRLHRDWPDLSPALRQELVRHEGGTIHDAISHPDDTYTAPPFLILSRPVTWGEVEIAVGPGEAEAYRELVAKALRIGPALLTPTTPALVDWHIAQRCARALGARLPTVPEARLALDDGLIGEVPDFEYEWTSAYMGAEPGTRYRLAIRLDENGKRKLDHHFEARWPLGRPTCFRLVVPVKK